MRVLQAVDQAESAPEVGAWVRALGLPEPVIEWMHVVPTQAKSVWALEPLLATMHLGQVEERAATQKEADLEAIAQHDAPPPRVRVRIGNPPELLLNRADETQTELIALRASNKGSLSALLLGSVARALVEAARQSVLLTRGAPPARPLHLLVATDHSDYAEKALARLGTWAPTGVGELTVLFVLPPPLRADIEQLAQEIAHEALHQPLITPKERTEQVAQSLGEALGVPPERRSVRLATGGVSAAIEQALESTGADLLVLGARGHGLLDRLTLGSVSFRAVTTCPKSVLVLRAP